jgi:hypothetical protein
MIPRKEIENFVHIPPPRVQRVAIVLNVNTPLSILRRRLNTEYAAVRNSFRHRASNYHRFVAERASFAHSCARAARPWTRFDCSIGRKASWLANQHDELSGRQIFLGAKLHPENPCFLATEFPSAISRASRRRAKQRNSSSRARAAMTAPPSAGCAARAVCRGRPSTPCSPTSSRASTESAPSTHTAVSAS